MKQPDCKAQPRPPIFTEFKLVQEGKEIKLTIEAPQEIADLLFVYLRNGIDYFVHIYSGDNVVRTAGSTDEPD